MALGDLIVRVGADIEAFRVAMKDAVDQVDYFADEVEKKFRGIEDVGERLAKIGAGLTAAVTLPLVGIGTAAVTTAAQFETTQIAYTTLMGSATLATEKLKELYQFAATTPFEVKDVLQGTRTLLAMQFAAKDVLPVMRAVGDAASGLGLGQEGLQRLIFHLGQIKALGTIDGHIIREMGQAGINAGQMLADALGVTVPEVMEKVHNKAIGATVAINALLAGMTRDFGGLMQAQSESLAGLWSNLKDNVTLSLVEIGNTLLPTGKVIVQFLMDMTAHVKEVAKWFAELPAPVQAAVFALGGIVAAAGPILLFLGGAAIAIPPVIALLSGLALALGTTGATLAVATAGLSLLLPALVAFGVWLDSKGAALDAFFTNFGKTGNIGSAVRAFQDVAASAGEAAKQTEAINAAMKALRLGGNTEAPVLSDPKQAWEEKHKVAVAEATKAVDVLTAAQARGAVTARTLEDAQKRLQAVMAQKMPDFSEREAKDKNTLSDPEKARAKELDGELAHSKAMFAIEADRVQFQLKMGQISEEDSIEQLNALHAREIEAEKAAFEKKKVIYHNNLTEKQNLDNQLAALQDKAALSSQQSVEKMELHHKKQAEEAQKALEKLNAFMSKMSVEGTDIAMKMGADIVKVNAELAKVGEERGEEAEQNRLAMERLGIEREYALQIGKTASSEIAYHKQLVEMDRQELERKLQLLEAEKALETNEVKREQIQLRIEQTRNQGHEREFAALTKIQQLEQANTVRGNIQIGLWNTFNHVFQNISQTISHAIVNGQKFGQTMMSIVKSIGQEILQTLIGAALGALQKAISNQVASWLGLKAVSSAINVAEVKGSAAVGGAAAFASIAAIPIIGPALAPEAGAAAFAAILGTYGPLAAFETGTDFVPSTGIAMIHQGERIIDASGNKEITAALSRGLGGGGGSVTVHLNAHGVNDPDKLLHLISKRLKQRGGLTFSPA